MHVNKKFLLNVYEYHEESIKKKCEEVEKERIEREKKESKKGCDETFKKLLIHILRGVAKGFLIHFIPVLILRRRITGLRRSVALGVLVGGVRGLDRGLTWLTRGTQIKVPSWVKKYRLAIAGGVSSLIAINIETSLFKSSVVVIWLLVRAIRTMVPDVPYGSTIMMILSAGQLLSTWMWAPYEHYPSYLKFLDHHGGKPLKSLRLLRTWGTRPIYYAVSPHKNFFQHSISFFRDGFYRSLSVYIPLYLAFFIFSKKQNISFLLRNIFFSSCFLSLYCTLGWVSALLYYPATGFPLNRLSLFIHTSLAGISTLLERPSRRPELAGYCVTYALEAFYRHLRLRGILPQLPILGKLAMVFSFAVMLHNIEKQPAFLRDFLFKLKKESIPDTEGELLNVTSLRTSFSVSDLEGMEERYNNNSRRYNYNANNTHNNNYPNFRGSS